jgi:hypothetical protein
LSSSQQEKEVTRGTGEVLPKISPKDEVPKFLATEKGIVVDTDTGKVRSTDVTTIGGVVVDLKEWGEQGYKFIVEMYEEFLSAVQQDREPEYSVDDGTDMIIDYIRNRWPELGSLFRRKPKKGKVDPVVYVAWNQHRTFDEWVKFSIATIKWRVERDIPTRYLMGDILHESDKQKILDVIELSLETLERYLSLSDRKKLISV